MNTNQKILVALSAGVHFLFAFLCVAGDITDTHYDIAPILSMFLMAPSLACGATIIVSSLKRFWIDNRRGQLPLLLLGMIFLCNTVVYIQWGDPFWWISEPSMWSRLFPIIAIQYICCLITSCIVRWLFVKLDNSQ